MLQLDEILRSRIGGSIKIGDGKFCSSLVEIFLSSEKEKHVGLN